MTFELTTPSLQAAEAATAERLEQFPESHIFQFADREIAIIRARIIGGGALDKGFYDSINIGLMCARELEHNDIEYCDVIYSMLEDLRLATAT